MANFAANHGKKGQLVSTELVLCASIFMAAILVFLFSWNTISAAYYEEQANRDMEVVLLGISDMAVSSPGNPADWEASALSGANSFGFAESSNVLSPAKLSALAALDSDYKAVAERMGAGRFDMSIAVLDGNGEALPYSFGRAVDYRNDSIVSVSAERLAILDGAPVRFRVQVWRQAGGAAPQ